jgi:hypothetical protein
MPLDPMVTFARWLGRTGCSKIKRFSTMKVQVPHPLRFSGRAPTPTPRFTFDIAWPLGEELPPLTQLMATKSHPRLRKGSALLKPKMLKGSDREYSAWAQAEVIKLMDQVLLEQRAFVGPFTIHITHLDLVAAALDVCGPHLFPGEEEAKSIRRRRAELCSELATKHHGRPWSSIAK